MIVYILSKEAGRDQEGDIFYKAFRAFANYEKLKQFLEGQKEQNKYTMWDVDSFQVIE